MRHLHNQERGWWTSLSAAGGALSSSASFAARHSALLMLLAVMLAAAALTHAVLFATHDIHATAAANQTVWLRLLLFAHSLLPGARCRIAALVSGRDRNGRTPLHYAASARMVGLLVAYGADVEARDAKGNTPAHCVAAGVAPGQAGNGGGGGKGGPGGNRGWLDWSCGWVARSLYGSPSPSTMSALLAAGADPTVRNASGRTPMHAAATAGTSGVTTRSGGERAAVADRLYVEQGAREGAGRGVVALLSEAVAAGRSWPAAAYQEGEFGECGAFTFTHTDNVTPHTACHFYTCLINLPHFLQASAMISLAAWQRLHTGTSEATAPSTCSLTAAPLASQPSCYAPCTVNLRRAHVV